MLPYNKNLKPLARDLRARMTDAERFLWSRLRGRQMMGRQFYRQKTIESYIVDFYCAQEDLVIELDGGQHYSQVGLEKDRRREEDLARLGLRVLRFSDADVLRNLGGVLEEIGRYCEQGR